MVFPLIVLLAALLLGGIPIFIALSFSSFLAISWFSDIPPVMMAQRLFAGIDRFALMSMPFFIFAANVMNAGGLSRRIVDWSLTLVGRLPGGLALTTQAACMFFGALSGSSPATVVAMGSVMYPEMVKKHYPHHFVTGLLAASGSVAILIPPSITLIVYGAVTGASIGALFIAGIGAGLVYGLAIFAYCWWYAVKHRLPKEEPSSFADIWQATKEAGWALGVPILILGGIYAGVFTPTEAAGVSVIYALFVSIVIYRELDRKRLYEVLVRSAVATAQIMVLTASASVFAWLLTTSQAPQSLTAFMMGISESPYVFLLLLNLLLLVIGMFMDGSAAVIIMAPLVYPLALRLGISPVHLGIIMTANLAIGMFTPPFGLNLFVASGVTELPMERIIPGTLAFIGVTLIALALITYVPDISLALPRAVYGGIR